MFASAKQKIERADYHIADIEGQFAAFVAEKPHKFVVQSSPDGSGIVVMIRFRKSPPSTLATVIGDAIHNMRCALDHMTWELAGTFGGTQDHHLKFPTGNNRINFESSCSGIKIFCQWAKDAICALEAFPDGKGSRLYEIHRLDNLDKHAEISPVLRATGVPLIRATKPDGEVIESTERQIIALEGAGEGVPLLALPAGSFIELDDDARCPPSIFTRKASNGHYVPTISFLKSCSEAVKDAINSVESATPF